MLLVQVTVDNLQACSFLTQNEDHEKQNLRKRQKHELYFIQLHPNKK
jgi:hypothetical protein